MEPDILELADSAGIFGSLIAAVDAAELRETLEGDGPFTVLAPTDEAFFKLANKVLGLNLPADTPPADVAVAILNATDAATVTNVLLAHVVVGETLSVADLDAQDPASALGGFNIVVEGTEVIDADPEEVDPTIVSGPDGLAASNGIVHVIDRVILPIDLPGLGTIADIAVASDDFTILVEALTRADLVGAVSNPEDHLTVFAPTNAAFAATAAALGIVATPEDALALTPEQVVDALVDALAPLGGGDGVAVLTDILLYHVSPGSKTFTDLQAAGFAETLLADGVLGIDGTSVVDAEPDFADALLDGASEGVPAQNGVIHPVSQVLLPVDVLLPAGDPVTPIEGAGTQQDDVIGLSAGDDRFNGLKGDDVIIGNAGDDKIGGQKGADILFGGAGDDRLRGNRDDDQLFGGSGNDRLIGNKDDDQLFGGDGDDRLIGGNDDDLLVGGDGDDRMGGGNGDDTFVDGAGDDIMRGGNGADAFDFTALEGDNIVRDFRSGQDTLIVSTEDFADFDALMAATTDLGGRGIEIASGEDTILLRKVDELDAGDVVFV